MEIAEIIKNCNLNHIAIIMDGNRRWAKEKHLPSMVGHKTGVEALKRTVQACGELNIKYLTVYAFSTENWNREQSEVDFLMELLANTINNELKELHENNVKINYIGDLTRLNSNLQKILQNSVDTTKNNTGVNLNIAINYGARDEIICAVKKIISKDIKVEDVNEKLISNNLYTKNIPDPDMVIRTSGEKRISNFLLWQIAYSEIYVTQSYWPDFDKEKLIEAIKDFAKRKRRRGK